MPGVRVFVCVIVCVCVDVCVCVFVCVYVCVCVTGLWPGRVEDARSRDTGLSGTEGGTLTLGLPGRQRTGRNVSIARFVFKATGHREKTGGVRV